MHPAISVFRSLIPPESYLFSDTVRYLPSQLQLRAPSLEDLQQSYRELSPEFQQSGLDDRIGFGEDNRYVSSLEVCYIRRR